MLSNLFNRRNNISLDNIFSRYIDLDATNQVGFFSNAINTRTYGIDLVLNGSCHFSKSSFPYTLAANINRTKIFGRVQVPDSLPANGLNANILFNRADRAMIEKGQPQDKVTLVIDYRNGPLSLVLTNTHYGQTTVFHENNPGLDQLFSPKILTDVSAHYKLKSWLTVSVGANNIFYVYPDPIHYYGNTNYGLFIYSPEASPFGFY